MAFLFNRFQKVCAKAALSDQLKTTLNCAKCLGIVKPGGCNIGILPGYVHRLGSIGLVSRSGSLTYGVRPICSKTQVASFLPQDQAGISKELICIFNRLPSSPDNPELRNLAPKLTHKIVESVLIGLKSWKAALSFF